MNFAGFAAGLGQTQSPENQAQLQAIQARRAALAAQARQDQAQAAFIQSLLTPDAQALPQQGPPGMVAPPPPAPSGTQAPLSGAPPAAPPPMQANGYPTGSGPMGGGPQAYPPGGAQPPAPSAAPMQRPQPGPAALPPQAAPPAAGGPAGASQPGAAGPGPRPGMPDPIARLRQMAQQIARANPGLATTPQGRMTIASALQQQVEMARGLAPEDRMLMQTELAQQKFLMTRDLEQFKADTKIALKEQDIAQRDRSLAERERNDTARAAAAGGGQGGALSKDDLDFMADQYLAGDKSVLQGLGYGRVGAQNRAQLREAVMRIGKQRGMSGKDVAGAVAEFGGIQQSERTLGTRSANLGLALQEAKQFAPMVLAASEGVDRTQFPTLNAAEEAAQKGTGGEAVVRLIVATNALKNAYAQAVTRGGQSTDDARKRADEVMNYAWSKGQIKTAVDQLMMEMEAAQQAPGAVRSELRGAISRGGAGQPAAAAPPPAAGAPAAGGWSVEEVK